MSDLKGQRILGIDPGTNILGYAVIDVKGDDINIITMGELRLQRLNSHFEKLGRIFTRVSHLVVTYKPDTLSIEAPFFGKNVQSMLKLGRAQGVAIAAGMKESVEIIEYSPKKIKKAITGNGNATKEQVAVMLQQTIKKGILDSKYLDSTDALAAAVCHSYQKTTLGDGKKYKDWSAYIKANDDKVSK